MTTTGAAWSDRGILLVIGLLAVGVAAVTFAYLYRTQPQETVQGVLQSRGLPAARRGLALAQAGRTLLSVEEQAEMNALYAEAFAALTDAQRQAFRALVDRADRGDEDVVVELSRLILAAISELSAEKSQRLFGLVEKAVALQLAAERRPSPIGPGQEQTH